MSDLVPAAEVPARIAAYIETNTPGASAMQLGDMHQIAEKGRRGHGNRASLLADQPCRNNRVPDILQHRPDPQHQGHDAGVHEPGLMRDR
ncbi:MAG: hypothetical protein P1U65_18185 [Minwuia sp.]|nr:hypothetical protein [Minwuia sp.]